MRGIEFVRSGSVVTMAACMASLAGGLLLMLAFDDARLVGLVRMCVVIGVLLHALGLVFGARAVIGVGVSAVAAGAVLATAEGPSTQDLIVCVLVAALGYVAAELGWEAIDRRDGLLRHRSADLVRIREVATVLAVTGTLAVAAIVGSGAPPTRSLPLQALVVLTFCAIVASAAMRLRASQESDNESG